VDRRQHPRIEERERLERFLEWRRQQRGTRQPVVRRRRLHSVAQIASLGMIMVALTLVWVMTRGSRDTGRHAIFELRHAPANDVATPSDDSRPGFSPSPPASISSSSTRGDTDVIMAGPTPAAEGRPLVAGRGPRIEHRADQRVGTVGAAPALPRRQWSSPLTLAREDRAQPSDVATAGAPSPSADPASTASEASTAPTSMEAGRRYATSESFKPPGTPGGAEGAIEPSAGPSLLPPMALIAATPAKPLGPAHDAVNTPRSERIETLKRLVGYIPEVRVGKAIIRWVKSQPTGDPGPRPEPQSHQAR
jgi:hypothetical protein